jgi:hypothetical protein
MAPATNRALEIVTPPREAFLATIGKYSFDKRECITLKDYTEGGSRNRRQIGIHDAQLV